MADYRLALLYHPDSTHPSSSPHHFSLLNRAYKLLSSPHARALYHRTGLGWGTAHDVAAGRTGGAGGFSRASDEELRRQARARAYNYAYSASGSAGGGAGYAGYANGRGGQSYDQARWGAGHEGPDGMGNPNPNGNYTTNTRFIGSLLIVVSTRSKSDHQITDFGRSERPIQPDTIQSRSERLAMDTGYARRETYGVCLSQFSPSPLANPPPAPLKPSQKRSKKPRCMAENVGNESADWCVAEKSKGNSNDGWRRPRRGGQRLPLLGIRLRAVMVLVYSLSLKSVIVR